MNWVPSLPLVALYAPFYYPGAYLPLVGLLGAIPAIALAFVYAKLSAAMPRSGGDYVWSTRILGPLYGSVQFVFVTATIVVTIMGFSAFMVPALGLSPAFFALGVLMNNAGFIGIASGLSTASLGYPVTLTALILCTLLGLGGLRLYSRIQRLCYIFVYVMAGAFLIGLLTLNFSNLPANFNLAMQLAGYGNSTYAGVLAQASSQSQFNLGNTLLAVLPWGFLTFVSFNFGTYLAGETKDVKPTMFRSMMLSVAITATALVVYFMIFYNDFGASFINAAAYVAANNPSYLPVLPTVTLLFSLVSPLLGVLLGISFAVAAFMSLYIYVIVFSRMMFAAAFDRLLPVKLANVSERFSTPYWAILLVGALEMIYMTVYWNFGYAATYLNISMISPIGFMLPLIAVLLFPKVRKDLYKRVMTGLGSPVILALAALVGIVSFFVYAFAETFPIMGGAFLGSSLSIAYSAVFGIFVIGLLVYGSARLRAKRDDIDFSRVYSEVPPE